MPRFRFKLQSVLEMRERAEQAQQARFAAANAAVLAIRQRAERIAGELREGRDTLRSRLMPAEGRAAAPSPVNMAEVRAGSAAALHGTLRLQRAAIEMAGASVKAEAARADLLKAGIRRKAVQSLRDRALARFRAEQARREALEQDDQNIMRARLRSQADQPLSTDTNDPGALA